ncbi:hypothetical protein PG985_008580 [Apiospora marii]|uniref:Uncharacterized protein n=1 Tax=Apiospora marii TaxID=335849 RepID=A0ABR1R2U2_9PEZI
MGLPLLKEFLYHCFVSGFRWNTRRRWSEKHQAYIFYSLLSADYSKPLIKGIVQSSKRKDGKGIPNLRKDTVGDLFALIWNCAAENVKFCKDLTPREFFAECKANYECADTIPDEALYQFTLRAIHARNIFKEYQQHWQKSEGTAMSEAIDNFIDAFGKEYDIRYGIDEMEKPFRERDQAKIEASMAIRGKNLSIRNHYLPVPLVSGDGDGSPDNRMFVDKEYTEEMARRVADTTNPAAQVPPVDGQIGPEQPSADVEPSWEFPVDVVDSDDEADYEDWEDGFLEGLEDEVDDTTSGNEDIANNDAELDNLAANLKFKEEEDSMELDG